VYQPQVSVGLVRFSPVKPATGTYMRFASFHPIRCRNGVIWLRISLYLKENKYKYKYKYNCNYFLRMKSIKTQFGPHRAEHGSENPYLCSLQLQASILLTATIKCETPRDFANILCSLVCHSIWIGFQLKSIDTNQLNAAQVFFFSSRTYQSTSLSHSPDRHHAIQSRILPDDCRLQELPHLPLRHR
jgi:hypothetical protein